MDSLHTKELLQLYGYEPKKSLGQNFLISNEITSQIASLADISQDDVIIEIGGGLGGLTTELLQSGAQVVVIEIDQRMHKVLEESVASKWKNCVLLPPTDVRELDLAKVETVSQALEQGKHLKVVANLPYYCTSEVLQQVLCQVPNLERLVVLIQKEAAQRVSAQVNTKQYGPLSVLLQLYGKKLKHITVPAHCFYPRPTVTSQVVAWEKRATSELAPKDKEEIGKEKKDFACFLANAFAYRRKRLMKNLSLAYPALTLQTIESVWQCLGLALEARAEQITPEQFKQIYLALKSGLRKEEIC